MIGPDPQDLSPILSIVHDGLEKILKNIRNQHNLKPMFLSLRVNLCKTVKHVFENRQHGIVNLILQKNCLTFRLVNVNLSG